MPPPAVTWYSGNQCEKKMRELLESGEYSDFQVTCQGETWNVHQAVICPPSEYFKKVCSLTNFKEGVEKKIDLPEDKELVGWMFHYLYIKEYPVPTHCVPRGGGLDKDVMMYILSDKYMIPDLKAEAGASFRNKLEYLCGTLASPDEGCTPRTHDDSVHEDICRAIQIIYDDLSEDDWPRWYMVQSIVWGRANFLTNEKFKDFLKNHQVFNDDFIDELAWDSKVWRWTKEDREYWDQSEVRWWDPPKYPVRPEVQDMDRSPWIKRSTENDG